ncbi:mitochondrial fission protein ELM1 [Thiogranum longum]|uniref:Mitochondrial fission protein ELM1 n=1 Tax=Thiogranum longum TaxID=1537524 RepID=A0A4R1HEJ8_9GAMM|nr:ELM1/GtrOC1 family putative glycosyltransferase [Thiogranum longum]TCK19073.1 mitochondrial fission protein ELM1 [Thiogranum longum]
MSKQTPRIWLVTGDKPGDNAQIEIIAEALGLPCEIKRMLPRPEYVLGKPRFKASLYHLDPERSDSLEPPWPDLIITIGRRPSMAALWIQQQSGGHSKIVLLGRPKRWMNRFSLIIVPSQYRMPDDPKVLQLDFPLMRSNEQAIARASQEWAKRFAELPRPITALMVGGQTKPFRFDADAARQLLAQTSTLSDNGFLYITTSRRTPEAVIQVFRENLPSNAKLYCWSPDNTDNPYLALLGLADRFIVTGDSMSMMIEVARLGKPLAIYPLPVQRNIFRKLQHRLGNWLRGKKAGELLYKTGMVGYTRDLTAIHQLLYDKGLAVPLGQTLPSPGKKPEDELQRVVVSINKLIN